MSGAPKVRSMNVTDSEARSILGLAGNKALGPLTTRKPMSKTSKKTDMSPEEGSIGGKNRVVATSSPTFTSTGGVPSILRRQVSLNASCSSDASTDSFQSRASTGRIYRTSSNARGRKQLASKPKTVVFDTASQTPQDDLQPKKRCAWVTSSSDQLYAIFHDEEWGVPVHDDKLLFELLVLTGAQVGSDFASVLKKRQKFREAFSGFEAEIVGKFTDIKITTLSSSYGIDAGFIRGVVDNSNCILEIKKAFGSFDKYIWGFLNHKPIQTNYKPNQKMPVKTSKSEAISKDMVRRGFRQVGPTVIHSFMQSAGLTNDHLTTCSRHNKLERQSTISNC